MLGKFETKALTEEESAQVAEALENDLIYIDETLIKRLDFILAAVVAERTVDYDFGATSYSPISGIISHLQFARKYMQEIIEQKNRLRAVAENLNKSKGLSPEA